MAPIETPLLLRTIETVIVLIAIPYLSYKFWALRTHFIISSRFPKLTMLITMSLLLLQIWSILPDYIDIIVDGIQQHIWHRAMSYNQALYFVFFILIILRTYFVYRQGQISQNRLKQRTSILLNALNTDNFDTDTDNDDSIEYVFLSTAQKIAIFIFISIGFIALSTLLTVRYLILSDCSDSNHSICTIITYIMISVWILSMMIGLFILILTRKTKEAINCRKETCITITFFFFQFDKCTRKV